VSRPAAEAGTRYKGRAGQWAFLAHRISGFLVFLFLMLHVIGLLFGLLFHSFNGLRIVAVDVFPEAVRNQRRLLQIAVAITVLAGVPGGIVILWPFINGRIL